MPRPPKGGPKVRTFKNPLTGATVTRSKMIDDQGRKVKTTSYDYNGTKIERTKTKYPSNYKEKETKITRTAADKINNRLRNVPKDRDYITESTTRRKSKGVNPNIPVNAAAKQPMSTWSSPGAVKPLDSRAMMTQQGKYRKKAKETIKEGVYKHGRTYDLNQKLKENLNGFKRRQELRGQQAYDKNDRLMSDVRYYKRVDPNERVVRSTYKKGGTKEMIKRADGSYSQRGLWDNIRANKGSGRKPTKEMLKQERKIKAKSKKK